MNSAEKAFDFDVEDTGYQDEPHSGIQEKNGSSEIKKSVELGEHIQELQEGDTPEDAIEILIFALREAEKNNEPKAFITCTEESDPACTALKAELKRRVSNGSIDSYKSEPMSGRIGFIITLKKEGAMDKAA